MKCKKCGNEVDIGEVFCQKCGTAIQIVPDYNPLEFEIEVPIEEKNKAVLEQERRKKQRKEQLRRKKQRQRILLIAAASLTALVCVVGAVLFVRYQKIHSYHYQSALGMEYYSKEEYGSAIQCFKEALAASHDEREGIEVKLLMAECYRSLGDYDRTVELLLEIVNTEKSAVYYQKLMEACELAGNTELMNRILKETQGTSIGDALAQYRTGELSADIAGGEYHDYLSVTLTNSQSGSVIYYTLDGSEPNAASTVYIGPIAIEKVGKTTLRAIAVNEAGLAGEELKEEYTISLVVPEAPVISPESGKYEYGKEIEITLPEGEAAVYYTIDGTIPNAETSYLYEGPVTMPIGNTIFSAIIVDKYGVSSSVAKKNYECTIDRAFPYDAAVIKLKNYLVSLGIMSDLNGNRGNGERISVQFVSLSEIAGAEGMEECYIFTLRRTADGETATLEEMAYAVTTDKGEVHSLTANGEGGYSYLPDNIQE